MSDYWQLKWPLIACPDECLADLKRADSDDKKTNRRKEPFARISVVAIMLGFAGKTPLPDQLTSGEIRKIKPWPDLPRFEVCTFGIT